MTVLEKIKKAVEESKNFPNPTIDYNFDLPEHPEVKPDNFFGVKSNFNKQVTNSLGYQVIYRLQ